MRRETPWSPQSPLFRPLLGRAPSGKQGLRLEVFSRLLDAPGLVWRRSRSLGASAGSPVNARRYGRSATWSELERAGVMTGRPDFKSTALPVEASPPGQERPALTIYQPAVPGWQELGRDSATCSRPSRLASFPCPPKRLLSPFDRFGDEPHGVAVGDGKEGFVQIAVALTAGSLVRQRRPDGRVQSCGPPTSVLVASNSGGE